MLNAGGHAVKQGRGINLVDIIQFRLSLTSATGYSSNGWFANRVVRDVLPVPHLLARLPTFKAGTSAAFNRDPESKKTADRRLSGEDEQR